MEKGKKLISRRELIPALAAVLVLAGVWLWRARQPDAAVAHIQVNGEEVMAVPLDRDGRISLRESHGVPVEFEIAGGAIRFVNVDCPDHTCERMGFQSRAGQTAVCMPNNTVLMVTE